jgi:hypothetical protein
MLVTQDESGFLFEYQHSIKRSLAPDEIPTRVSQTISKKKVKIVLAVIWRIDGFYVVDMMPPGGVSTPSTSLLRLWILGWQRSFGKEGKPDTSTGYPTRQLSVHSSNTLKQFCDENSLVAVRHLAYSPDLA